ncbi:hypothetical protein [Mycobacterium sp. DL440]|uniref:hypothetical protein n=1 Tax=Mycobacterium sp. DL440 TaxID=2675523 RepID=UPI001FB99E45|nr:hypothetical protein [Mycobacterium sp. DL440]
MAEETEAKARLAAAEADVKAAEAARLQERAGAHTSDAAASREELNKDWERADAIDPDYKSKEAQPDTDRRSNPDERVSRSPENG